MSEPCSEKGTLATISTNVEWIKETLKDMKGIGVYKKLTWFNLAILVGIAGKLLYKGLGN